MGYCLKHHVINPRRYQNLIFIKNCYFNYSLIILVQLTLVEIKIFLKKSYYTVFIISINSIIQNIKTIGK